VSGIVSREQAAGQQAGAAAIRAASGHRRATASQQTLRTYSINGNIGDGRGRRRPGSRPAGVLAGALAGTVLLIAACGGGSPAAVAGSANYQKAVAYAQCMRTHGVPDYPDPNSQGVFMGLKHAACMRAHGIAKFPDPNRGDGFNLGEMISLGIDINSPQYKSAQQACFTGAGGL
jgi:hypothetical protein